MPDPKSRTRLSPGWGGAGTRARRRRRALEWLAATAVAAAAAGAGCRDAPKPAEAGGGTVHRYTVRGEVVQPPAPGRSPAQLTVRHEAIPDFVDRSGKTVGMPAMTMALDLAPGAGAGVRAGDKVELVLAVDWTRPLLQVESVKPLPGDTPLRFATGP